MWIINLVTETCCLFSSFFLWFNAVVLYIGHNTYFPRRNKTLATHHGMHRYMQYSYQGGGTVVCSTEAVPLKKDVLRSESLIPRLCLWILYFRRPSLTYAALWNVSTLMSIMWLKIHSVLWRIVVYSFKRSDEGEQMKRTWGTAGRDAVFLTALQSHWAVKHWFF